MPVCQERYWLRREVRRVGGCASYLSESKIFSGVNASLSSVSGQRDREVVGAKASRRLAVHQGELYLK
jgi:hypothetical protein